jgi:tRNA(adenine34) deaminase
MKSNASQTQHDNWMALALEEARQVIQDVPIGCIVVLNDQLIARSHNQREENQDPTAHAEILALRQAASHLGTWRLNDCIVYTTLEPCPMCAEAIIQARVRRVVFGAYDNISGALGSAFNLYCSGRVYPIPEVIGGVEEEACRELLVEFFKTNTHRD